MNRALLYSLLVASAYAHGVILKTIGANGVIAPGACGKFYSSLRPSRNLSRLYITHLPHL